MGLETASYIGDLNAANPAGADPKSQGDDHIRLLKSTIKATFPNVSGAMVRTHTELNTVTDRGIRTGDTWTGSHDFTGATVTVATASGGDADASPASTAFVDTWFAKKASPTFTGTPVAPTAVPGTNTTQIATTAFATQLAFQAALPVQTAPAMLYTNGATASWRTAFVGDHGSGGEVGPVPAPVAGDASRFLKGDGSWALSPSSPDVIIQDQKTSANGGQALAHNTITNRDLNTVVRNVGNVGALSGNALTLPPGVWLLRARASFRAGASANGARGFTIINNQTDGVELARGELVSCGSASVGGISEAVAVATLATPKAIRIQTAYAATNVGDGGDPIGVTIGGVNVYATLEATRLS